MTNKGDTMRKNIKECLERALFLWHRLAEKKIPEKTDGDHHITIRYQLDECWSVDVFYDGDDFDYLETFYEQLPGSSEIEEYDVFDNDNHEGFSIFKNWYPESQ